MPKSELKARLATRKAHRADVAVTRHTGAPGKSWVAGARADKARMNPAPFFDHPNIRLQAALNRGRAIAKAMQ